MKSLFLAAVVATLAINAQAGRVRSREAHQDKRIANGVQSGELTKHEARKLARGQKKVNQARKEAHADGNVTPEERAKLEAMQDRQSKKIYNQKHDGQDRSKVAQPGNPGEPSSPASPEPAPAPEGSN